MLGLSQKSRTASSFCACLWLFYCTFSGWCVFIQIISFNLCHELILRTDQCHSDTASCHLKLAFSNASETVMPSVIWLNCHNMSQYVTIIVTICNAVKASSSRRYTSHCFHPVLFQTTVFRLQFLLPHPFIAVILVGKTNAAIRLAKYRF